MSHNYYMVRAMDSTEQYFNAFFGSGIVGVGWSNVDFTEYASSEELREAVRLSYYMDNQYRQQLVSKHLNEVERFKNIQSGDYILVPYYSGVAIAVAEEKEIHANDAVEINLVNQRRVQYRRKNGELLVVPRNELSEGLQRRLRVPGNSVSNLYEFHEEIDRLFSADSYSYSMAQQEKEDSHLQKLRSSLIDRIRQGDTNLQTGGIGLERLVCELMRIEGYTANVLAKTKFAGKADADIEAYRTDAFSNAKILVQVKHHSGISPRAGIQQIVEVLEQTQYEDYDGWFVTSANVSEDDLLFAKEHGIHVMEGHDLADLIISDADKLPEEFRLRLGISRYPTLI